MHTIKITLNLLFEYHCTSGKFIRLPNRIETFFCPNWNALLPMDGRPIETATALNVYRIPRAYEVHYVTVARNILMQFHRWRHGTAYSSILWSFRCGISKLICQQKIAFPYEYSLLKFHILIVLYKTG